MKKPALLIVILFFAVIALSIIKTFVSNNIATSGVILGQTDEDLAKVKTENAVLAQKLYESSSLTNISKKAEKLGFIDGKTSYVLDSKLPIAAAKP